MIYKDESIPDNYNRIAEVSDNYIVFVKESVLYNGSDYKAYYQYIKPSTYIFYTENYRITKFDAYEESFDSYNNGVFSTLDSSIASFQLHTMTSEDFSSDDKYRADIIDIFFGQILCCIVILWIFKQLSRLVYRGGLC